MLIITLFRISIRLLQKYIKVTIIILIEVNDNKSTALHKYIILISYENYVYRNKLT